MPASKNPRQGQPSTYMVANLVNKEELQRITTQDHLLTCGMGGVLPEQADPTVFKHVLDVSCGSGGWLLTLATAYPGISQLVGIDLNPNLLRFAQAQAAAQQTQDRVTFLTMDALHPLDFADNTFDLVNLRCGWSYLRTWDWLKLLVELRRTCQPGGVIRLTEGNIVQSTSPALNQLGELFLQALYQAGHFFALHHRGVIDHLAPLLHTLGLTQRQTREWTLHFSAGTAEGQAFAEDMRHAYRTFIPFLQKWARFPDDYEVLYQQALDEMQRPDFVATWTLLTAWGTVN